MIYRPYFTYMVYVQDKEKTSYKCVSMKTVHISDTRTGGPRMTGLLLPLQYSYSTHVNLSQQVLEVSALYVKWYCSSHVPIFKVVIPRKQTALGHVFDFLFLFWIIEDVYKMWPLITENPYM
jgi:hypothetical protein